MRSRLEQVDVLRNQANAITRISHYGRSPNSVNHHGLHHGVMDGQGGTSNVVPCRSNTLVNNSISTVVATTSDSHTMKLKFFNQNVVRERHHWSSIGCTTVSSTSMERR